MYILDHFFAQISQMLLQTAHRMSQTILKSENPLEDIALCSTFCFIGDSTTMGPALLLSRQERWPGSRSHVALFWEGR